MKGRADRGEKVKTAGAEGRGGGKRILFSMVLMVLLLPSAYYLSYVWWGRNLFNPRPYTEPDPLEAEGPRWWAWVEEQVYPLWEPLRYWDFWRFERPRWSRCIESCAGAWGAEDGRILEVQLGFSEDWTWGGDEPWVEGSLRCEGDPRLNGYHLLGGLVEPGPNRPVLLFGRTGSPPLRLEFGGSRLSVLELGETPVSGGAPPTEILGEYYRKGEPTGDLEEEEERP